jgi:hypothetical protein
MVDMQEPETPFDDELRDVRRSGEYGRAEKHSRQVVLMGRQSGYRRRLADESRDLEDLRELAAAARDAISEVKGILYEGQIRSRAPSLAWLEGILSRMEGHTVVKNPWKERSVP